MVCVATCSGCGQAADDPPPTWTVEIGHRGTQWLCERCTREQLRAIEGRLEEWWA
jgi:hypothetical protein